jgi:hypothetical protein
VLLWQAALLQGSAGGSTLLSTSLPDSLHIVTDPKVSSHANLASLNPTIGKGVGSTGSMQVSQASSQSTHLADPLQYES